MTTRDVKINGMNLVFEDEGSGDPLVFLHGSMGSAGYWDVLVPLLLASYRCVRLEFPGHGRSDRFRAGPGSDAGGSDPASFGGSGSWCRRLPVRFLVIGSGRGHRGAH